MGLIDWWLSSRLPQQHFIDNGYPMLPQNAVDNGELRKDAGPAVGGNYWSDHPVSGNPGSDPKQVSTRGMDRYPFQDPTTAGGKR